jgi:4-oxalocrotonate tautomerase
MPVITVALLEGRSEDIKAELARALTDAVADIAGAPREGTVVIFQDYAKSDWAENGSLLSRR